MSVTEPDTERDTTGTCRRCGTRPGFRRYYAPNPCDPFAHVAGSTIKLSVKETVGCDECWEIFQIEYEAAKKRCKEAKDGTDTGAEDHTAT